MDIETKTESGFGHEVDHAKSKTPASPPPPPVSAQNASENLGALDFSSGRARAKSSLRLKYEAETHVIERKLGDLEAIRSSLGLSQRKIAQLLLVDPSAWTRWTKGGDEAPPHIYRMLQWYLALEEKYPALDVNFWLNTVAQMPAVRDQFDFEKLRTEVRMEVRMEVRREVQLEAAHRELPLRKMILLLAASTALVGCLVGFAIAKFVF